MWRAVRRSAASAGLAALVLAAGALAQTPEASDPIVVTATRTPERAFDLPVSIDSVNPTQIQQDQLQVNLSESLVRVPGISVVNRWNYAQDLQVSVRGFGARANFGVRGVRLYQDGIPATMPDGQGQTGSFSLVSAQRIEVLRGPFSTLYGNASGGVISVFTEDGGEPGFAQGQVIGGSYGTWNTVAKLEGGTPYASYVVAGNLFQTTGYREHSDASRDLANAKLRFTPGPDTTITLIGNYLSQPEAQDPLGLTRAEWEANPRQADPAATLFNTRKTVNQGQGGASIEQQLNADNVARVVVYGGQRTVRQYLALPGTGATSSGGVTDLDNDFGGVDARVTSHFSLGGGGLLVLTVGGDYDRQHQRRKGFVNNNGDLGDLRRNEDDYVSDNDVYLQAEWAPLAALSIIGGVRYSDVRFNSVDHYITSLNPDDSGQVGYTHTSPVLGALWHVTDKLNVYANWGEGFETPTFIELAYRNIGSGLNFGLQPAVSRSARDRPQGLSHAAATREPGALPDRHVERDHHRHRDRRPDDLQERQQDAAARRRGIVGGDARQRPERVCLVHVSVREVHVRRDHRHTAAPGAGGLALARGPGSERVRRAGVVASAVVGADRGDRRHIRGEDVRERAQHRLRSCLCDRQHPRRHRAAGEPVDPSRIRSVEQSLQPQLRRLGHRRRHQRPLLRARRGAQLLHRRERECKLLSPRRGIRGP